MNECQAAQMECIPLIRDDAMEHRSATSQAPFLDHCETRCQHQHDHHPVGERQSLLAPDLDDNNDEEIIIKDSRKTSIFGGLWHTFRFDNNNNNNKGNNITAQQLSSAATTTGARVVNINMQRNNRYSAPTSSGPDGTTTTLAASPLHHVVTGLERSNNNNNGYAAEEAATGRQSPIMRTVITADITGAEPNFATTAAAAAADIAESNETTNAALLRDWQATPVAPAVMVNTDDGGRGGYVYPVATEVATFVRGLVRSGFDLYQQQHQQHRGGDHYSVPTDPMASHQGHQQQVVSEDESTAQAISAQTLDEVLEGGAEYILVDGDLIELPPPLSSPNHGGGGGGLGSSVGSEQDQYMHYQHHHSRHDVYTEEIHERILREASRNNTCRQSSTKNTSRMRRGVRKLAKFFKRGKKSSHGSSNKGGEPATLPVVLDDGHPRQQPQPPTESTSPKRGGLRGSRKERSQHDIAQQVLEDQLGAAPPSNHMHEARGGASRKSRRSWRQQQRNESQIEPAEQDATSNVMTGLETPSIPTSTLPSFDTSELLSLSRAGSVGTVDMFYQDPLSPVEPSIALPQQPLPSSPPSGIALRDQTPNSSGRAESVMASFVGTADQVGGLEAGVIPADVAAVAFIDDSANTMDDLSYWKKDDGSLVPSSLPLEADYKVDKADAPDVESMLMRAAHETREDLDSSDIPTPLPMWLRGKSDSSGESTIPRAVPLSQARLGHNKRAEHPGSTTTVYNDMLKVIMVAAPGVPKSWLARALRNCQKRPRKRATLGVDVHSWTPVEPTTTPCSTGAQQQQDSSDSSLVRFMIWDVQGATGCPEDSANFGAHPGTQSLFFSGQSLYILASDLSWNNPLTCTRSHSEEDDDHDDDDEFSDDDDEEEGKMNAFSREEARRKANQALRADFTQRVLSWVDTIARRGPNSAILPVAVIPPGLSDVEVQRRCDVLQTVLMEHISRYDGEPGAPKLLSGADSQILCVYEEGGAGIGRLQDTIIAIASDVSRSVFDHVGTEVPPATVRVLESVRHFKDDHKLILLDHLLADMGGDSDDDQDAVPVEQVLEALQFLSDIGEILYFGSANDEVLSRYIVLSRKWLVSALSCILRNDLKRELAETRRFMNMQCIYSDHKFEENELIRTLISGTMSSCPLLSNDDAKMLWQSMSFMREASDHYAQLSENSTSAPTMFYFLERLLVYMGIFLPLGAMELTTSFEDRSEVFFVPSLLAQADPREVWTYKSSESWMTTLCHSWLFRDGVPSNLMEHLTVNVLRDIYVFSKEFRGGMAPRGDRISRVQTVPLRLTSMNAFLEGHDQEALGRVKIHQIVCWNSSLLIKIGTVFADHESGELRESFVEVFVAIVDQSANHCVASDAMRANMQRVIVSGKGQVGHHGRKIWKGGYEVVLKSVRESLALYSNVDFQVVCPECLARSNPRSASTWSWDSVYALAQTGSSVVRCMRGHRLDSNLICGTSAERKQPPALDTASTHRGSKPVSEILPSVVVVGLWDRNTKEIRSVGSGFVVDKKLGLVVTAGHVLFSMEGGRNFGRPYLGLPDARVVIGVIPDDGHKAVFRYYGEIIVDDIHNVDACVVHIKTRMEVDVDDEGAGCALQPERILTLDTMPDEQLKPLKMTSRFELEESIRVVGYNQGGEGVYEKGKHVNRSADFAKGYICRRFQAPLADDSSSSDSSSHMSFSPREEIVIMCPTIAGHSGGPCVNDEGKVVGILSRADPVDRQRCYLVPTSELKALVTRAKKQCSRTSTLASLPSL